MALAPAWRRARALEQRRQTSGNALKGAGRVGRAAFTAALRRWHLVILAGDVYRGNVGRRTLWIRALPSHSYQCASRPDGRVSGPGCPCSLRISRGLKPPSQDHERCRFRTPSHPSGTGKVPTVQHPGQQGTGCGVDNRTLTSPHPDQPRAHVTTGLHDQPLQANRAAQPHWNQPRGEGGPPARTRPWLASLPGEPVANPAKSHSGALQALNARDPRRTLGAPSRRLPGRPGQSD